MPESPNKIQKRIDYLRQIDIIQFGSTINEQINPSRLYEINLEDDMEDYQSFTTNQYGPTYFSTEPQTSYNEEPSRWLPKQDDSPCLESENDTDHDDLLELLKRVNEALETCEKAYDNNYVVTEEMSVEQDLLFNKINEILKPNYFLPHNEYTRRSNGFLQRHEKCASFNNDINYVSITGENELKSLMSKYTSSEDMDEQIHAYGNNFYNSTCLNNESNTIANLEEQFTGASLEYWGDHSINSIEHSLMQSEWNIPFNTV